MVKPLIAVVDDDLDMRQMLEAMLADADYDVQCWPSSLAAYNHLINSPPALLILDLCLGDDLEAGWTLLTFLRSAHQTSNVPVILLSGNMAFLRHREHIIRTKMHAVPVAKPFKLEDLLAQVEQMLISNA